MADKLIDIKVNDKKIQRYLKEQPRVMKKAIKVGVQKTAKFAKAQVAKEITKPGGLLNISQATAKKDISIVRKPTISAPVAQVRIKGRAIPIGKYGPRKTKKGVTFKVFTKGKRTLIKNAFIIKKGKWKGVFHRVNKNLRQLWGPAITDVFKFSKKTEKRIKKAIAKRLPKEILSQFDRFKVAK